MSAPDSTTRRCTKCHREFPATREFFYSQKAGKFGLASWCKECHRAVNKKNTHNWYQENKEHVAEYGKQYRLDNAERIAGYNKHYYWDNLERERKRTRESHIRYQPRVLRYNREYVRKNRNIVRAQHNKRHAHRMQNDLEYRLRSQISHKKGKARRRAREVSAEGTHTAEDIRQQIRSQTDKQGHLYCWWCGNVIEGAYHLDHRIALAKGGSNGADNLVISCPTCNLSKQDKTPGEWAGRLL